MADMARRTTVVLRREDEEALREASRSAGISQSELIRRGIGLVTAPYRRRRRPRTGWLRLTRREIEAIRRDTFGDLDA
jgi:hypothetical protein